MNVGEKLKSRFEEDAHCLGIATKSKDSPVKAEKPVAKEPPHASFAPVDYAKLALLKPVSPAKAFHAASATLADPSVKKDLDAVRVAALPLVNATGAAVGDAAAAMGAAIGVSLALQAIVASGVTGQEELTPLAAGALVCCEVGFLKQAHSVYKDVSEVIDAGRAAVPVAREGAHTVMETLKKNLGW